MTTSKFKEKFRAFRKRVTWYAAEHTLQHLEALRSFELARIIALLPARGKILEIGAGTGWQASLLESRGYEVHGIDLPLESFLGTRIWPVIDYDGKHIPFEDNSFDVIFSSNVLEHVPHVREFQAEIHRVLKPEGVVIHLIPSSSWRIWSNIIQPIKYWTLPIVHGVHAGNAFTEIYYFSRQWWSRLFHDTNWNIIELSTNELFYTGCSILDSRLSINSRHRLSRLLGGACNIFVLNTEGLHRKHI